MASCQGDASRPPHHRQQQQQNHQPGQPSPPRSPSPPIDLLCALALALFRALGAADANGDRRQLHLGDLDLKPARLASMLLGTCLALMLCGSATFLIGFVLMPWVLGLLAALYVAGVITGVSRAARALVVAALGRDDDDDCCREDCSPGQLLTKFPII